MKIILASSNEGKVKEFKEILSPFKIEIISLKDLNYQKEIIEDGNSFFENALIKAKTIYNEYKMPVLADDSGLCCLGLDLKPGIYSARFKGLKDAKKRNEALLKELKDVKERRAYFTSTIIYYDGKITKEFRGRLNGYIGYEAKGNNGFGYDPIFYLENGLSLASLDSSEKNKISHRGLALKALKEWFLNDFTN